MTGRDASGAKGARLRELPLIWRFMIIPAMGILMMASLGWAFLDLRKDSVDQLDAMRVSIQERLQTVIDIGNQLAQTYSNIYQLLLDAPAMGDASEVNRLSRPELDDLRAIEDRLLRELPQFEANPALSADIHALIETLASARAASTNALLVTTLDSDDAAEQVRAVTDHFNDANWLILNIETQLQRDLSQQIEEIATGIRTRSFYLGLLMFGEFTVAIGVTILLIASMLRAVRRSVLDVSRITHAGAGRCGVSGAGNEITLLRRAIEDASRSHEQLKTAGASLERSNAALTRREQTLSEVNQKLAANVEQLQRAIKDRDAAETALSKAQRMEAIGNLTGGVAHDFNNLLAVVLGNLELMKDEDDDAARDRMVDAAIDATIRGADLTRNMLAFARRARLDPKVLDLNDIVRRTKNWAGRALPATVEVETSLLAGLWQVEADESSTESALLNLILNARDAMPDGGKLTIETANVRINDDDIDNRGEPMEPGRYVMLSVNDTGTGIPPDVLKQIFDPFFTTKAPGAGSGLGLSMIEGFTRQSGGAVRVTSEPGVGATFKLYFKARADDRAALAPKHAQIAPIDGDGARIFVVEDEPAVLVVLVATLKKAGYRVRSATSGDEAFEKFKADPAVDFLVTDIVMPGKLQGTGLAKELRKLRPSLPVVFMSGYANEATVHGNGLRPEDIRLMKPVRSVDLLRALEKARSKSAHGR